MSSLHLKYLWVRHSFVYYPRPMVIANVQFHPALHLVCISRPFELVFHLYIILAQCYSFGSNSMLCPNLWNLPQSKMFTKNLPFSQIIWLWVSNEMLEMIYDWGHCTNQSYCWVILPRMTLNYQIPPNYCSFFRYSMQHNLSYIKLEDLFFH